MTHDSQKGFTLLLSVLVISMVLSIALGITDIILKENRLSTLVKESEAAFHAADKGIDCALFYHIAYGQNTVAGVPAPLNYSPFTTSTDFQLPSNMNSVTCDGTVLNTLPSWSRSNPAPSTSSGLTTFRLDFADGSCADVRILNYNSGTSNDSTITSEGYNTCDVTSPKRTLRVIEVTTNL
jgi:Tfp pilus assembly protein PilX